MRYLVTGGAGFIGSHIVERLLKEGHFVRVLDNLSTGKLENLGLTSEHLRLTTNDQRPTTDKIDFIKGDIRDGDTCNTACQDIDFVLHQAALRSVPKSLKEPHSYNEVNINGTLNLLEAALKHKVKRFVFASSSSVYGDTSEFPEQEDFYPLLISPYALSKLAGEYYCRIFSEHHNLDTVSLRYFNVFGPRQALDDEYAVVIPKFIHCILHDEPPPIFGTGKQSRDFTYIDNVVEANLLAATVPLRNTQYAIRNTQHEVFNVANGQDHTVLELVDLLNKIIGKNIVPVFLAPRAGDVFRTCADISQIRQKLGLQIKVDFEEGLRRTVEYFKKTAH